ncbi:MAG: hypothetical protein MASP_00075 [Candidatus Methanolliviera sp. GoM_asphalt]|nr:MAG: hypothetical protein MASP_00075 [Candidatus Methanolliviera sp. GoM_asphalt]
MFDEMSETKNVLKNEDAFGILGTHESYLTIGAIFNTFTKSSDSMIQRNFWRDK